MADTFSPNQIKQFKAIIGEVLEDKLDSRFANFEQKVDQKFDEKLGENFLQRIENIEKNVDKIAKAVADDRDELDIVKARVSNHEVRLVALGSAS